MYPTPLRMIRAVESEGCTLFKRAARWWQLMTDPSNAPSWTPSTPRPDTMRDVLRRARLRRGAQVLARSHHRKVHQQLLGHRARRHGVLQGRGCAERPHEEGRHQVGREDVAASVSAALDSESSDVVIAGPYPSLALTVFGDVENVYNSNWRGDLSKYKETYWPKDGGGFVQGDVARASGEKGGGFTFHGRSDEVINVNGNRVGTEQIERCLWNLEADGYGVKDCAVVGAPDFVKGTTPVAFVVFEPLVGGVRSARWARVHPISPPLSPRLPLRWATRLILRRPRPHLRGERAAQDNHQQDGAKDASDAPRGR